MRGKSIALLILALGCGLVASIGITQVLAKRHGDSGGMHGETETVFVALKDVELGDVVDADELRAEEWPKDKVPAGALTKIEDVEGRRTRTKLYAGEPILANKLFAPGEGGRGTTAMIPKGYRVVSVKVDAVSAGGNLIMPGDRVDVLVYLKRDPVRGVPETGTRTILQDIKVFAVNNLVTPDKDDTGEPIKAATISLLVTPEQAAKLTLASELGTIRLVMRSPNDDTDAVDAQAAPGELFGQREKGDREKETLADPSPPPQKPSFLELIRAAQAKLAAGAASAEQPETPTTWTMRVLRADQTEEVNFELQTAAADSTGGVELWKSRRTDSTSGNTPSGSPVQAPDTPVDNAQPTGNAAGQPAGQSGATEGGSADEPPALVPDDAPATSED